MTNLTVPKAILIGSILVASAVMFRIDESLVLVSEAGAEVAGMDYTDLKSDSDFKKAVKYIVENCSVDDEDISC